MRPPIPRPLSSTRTGRPASAKMRAQVIPAIPLPMMIVSFMSGSSMLLSDESYAAAQERQLT